jgi:hypothetical protein
MRNFVVLTHPNLHAVLTHHFIVLIHHVLALVHNVVELGDHVAELVFRVAELAHHGAKLVRHPVLIRVWSHSSDVVELVHHVLSSSFVVVEFVCLVVILPHGPYKSKSLQGGPSEQSAGVNVLMM